MTKAKNKSSNREGTTPSHCYFWIATLTNNSIIPEYDFNKHEHRKASSLMVDHVKMFSWYPINLDMLIKIKQEFNEDVKLAISDKVHSLAIDLENGECLRVHPIWRNTLNFTGSPGSSTSYALFKTTPNGVRGYFINEDGGIKR